MRLWCCSALCVVWLLLMTLSAKGQVTTGAILGVVRDVSGATVAGARVEVRRLETNAAFEDRSDLQGRFRFLALPIGSYELTADRAGFSPYNRGPIVLRLNQEAELEVTLD